ncbi:cathepsin K-like [Vipera latastei]
MLSVSVTALIWLVFVRALSTASDPSLEGTWRDWKATHGKEYALQEEESFRRAVWQDNLRMIDEHNKQADLGRHTYWLGMNHFGDLTNEELDKRLRCLFSDFDNVTKGNGIVFESSDDPDIPDQVDWRIKGGVTEVKDQGSCLSGWSFSATGALEGMHFKKTGELVSLSEQNLIDCSKENKGCKGGWTTLAFESLQKQGGINSEKLYPYDMQDGMPCRYNPEESITRCSSFGEIKKGDEKALQEAVAKIGPISVGVDARSSKFHFYKSGIYEESHKGMQKITHAMLIVGYNDRKGYWILKNSWSTLWGEKGYMRLAKGSNQCSVADYCVFPIPDPEKGMQSSLPA